MIHNEENPGTAPFSEPESQMMRNLTSFEPHVWVVNVHSGMEVRCSTYMKPVGFFINCYSLFFIKDLFMPYDYKNTVPAGLRSEKMKLMLETLILLHCGDRCVVGSGDGSVGLVFFFV